MKLHFFIFSLLCGATISAMEPTQQLIDDVEEFIEATTDIENIDADLVSELVYQIRIKWTSIKSPELCPKYYLKDINLEK